MNRTRQPLRVSAAAEPASELTDTGPSSHLP